MSENYAVLGSEKPIDKDGYVTLISHVSSPSGFGEFEIRVSGQLQTVLHYQEQAKILRLEIKPVTGVRYLEDLAEKELLAAQRQIWLDRLEQVKSFIATAKLDQLADPDLICHSAQAPDKNVPMTSSEVDLSRDRLIEIQPLDNLDDNLAYQLSFTIDPDVPKGRKDIYSPVVQGSASAKASISVSAGDADLELYRGGALQSASRSSGPTDSVNSSRGVGNWQLYVIGFSTATYSLSGDWLLGQNNV